MKYHSYVTNKRGVLISRGAGKLSQNELSRGGSRNKREDRSFGLLYSNEHKCKMPRLTSLHGNASQNLATYVSLIDYLGSSTKVPILFPFLLLTQ